MRIGELAKAANCTVETIRYYEQQCLLPAPYRTQNNYRIYNKDHLDRLKFIRNCRNLDMAHDEIRELLKLANNTDENCTAVANLLEQHIQHVSQRLKELQELQQQLVDLHNRCQGNRPASHCNIVQELTEMDIPANSHKTHLG